ncbi:MAG: urate hydroxylase PuuD [Acidobacteriota bacterium]|nr:urate hydroxylase PuuD [Blastocatellia bacterium]MDW8239449.1 urate hydroxylase PuuD [Acidobacteriota bacterium]
MLPVVLTGLPVVVALLLQVHGPSGDELPRIFMRWVHFVAGIAWIGLLYFFNLVNVNFMKALDGPTKGKVVPELMPRALWWFRWGAVVTVLMGLGYYVMYILRPDAQNAKVPMGGVFIQWLGWSLLAWGIIYGFLMLVPGRIDKGWFIAVAVVLVVLIMSFLMIKTFTIPTPTGMHFTNKSASIGIGGGIGLIMMLNVWGIIWPHQKRIIAWTKANAQDGTPIPPESAQLARRAFMASRTNFWLSLPMLFFMATSHGDYIWFRP